MIKWVFLVVLILVCAGTAKTETIGGLAKIYSDQPGVWITLAPGAQSQGSQVLVPAPQLRQSGFTLSPAVPFLPDAEQGIFQFDLKNFLNSQGGADYAEASKIFVSRLGFDSGSFQYNRPFPYLKSWGTLFHPPLKTLPANLAVIDRRFAEPFQFEQEKYATPGFQKFLDRATESELTSGNRINFIHNGRTLQPIVDLVRRAQKYVLIEVLALSCDDQDEPLIGALEDRARHGIDVRILMHKTYALLARSCLNRLGRSGVQIAKDKIHSTYFVNDQNELIIGAQSISKTFFSSTGFNFLDRDSMLAVKGPVSTDAIHEFAVVWERARGHSQKDIAGLVESYKTKRAAELFSGVRGSANYTSWLDAHGSGHGLTQAAFQASGQALGQGPSGLCRFAVQHPSGEKRNLENLITAYLTASRSSITGSSVKFLYPLGVKSSTGRIAELLKAQAKAGVSVNLFGNGYDGGDGELTMLLDEKSDALEPRHPEIAALFEKINHLDVNHQAQVNLRQFKDLTSVSGLTVWTYFNFTHQKIWSFDRGAILVTSMNFDTKSFDSLYESGVICSDEGLRRGFENQQALDLVNSVPYFNGSF
jgi:phosphatidylserine/phosphatidylglycerophosphate/cardiolipin synthase-like enzyme